LVVRCSAALLVVVVVLGTAAVPKGHPGPMSMLVLVLRVRIWRHADEVGDVVVVRLLHYCSFSVSLLLVQQSCAFVARFHVDKRKTISCNFAGFG
jgi:hypothetical protein